MDDTARVVLEIRCAWRRNREVDRQLVGAVDFVAQPEARPSIRLIAQELDAIRPCRNPVVDRVPFIVEVGGAQAGRRREHDHQVLVMTLRAIVVVVPYEHLAAELRAERERSGGMMIRIFASPLSE
ncbi:MAG TPA: hypothetical protein VGL61_09465 [Kofleriaceae bacterium]